MADTLNAGERVAFARDGLLWTAVWPDLKRAVKVGQGQDISISADGKLVAYESSGTGERNFTVADAVTGKALRKRLGVMPKFSPSGRDIAFSQFVSSKWTANVTDTATLKASRSLASTGAAWVQDWAGEQIIANGDTFDGNALYIVSTSGNLVKKTPIGQIFGKRDYSIPFSVIYSSDLRRIVFNAATPELSKSDEGGEGNITGLFLFEVATGRVRQISPRGLYATSPHWYSKNLLTFIASPNTPKYTSSSLYLLNVATGQATKLAGNISEFTTGYKDSRQ